MDKQQQTKHVKQDRPICDQCQAASIKIRPDGSYSCNHCGYDSKTGKKSDRTGWCEYYPLLNPSQIFKKKISLFSSRSFNPDRFGKPVHSEHVPLHARQALAVAHFKDAFE